MNKRLQASLFKSLFKKPFEYCLKPISPFSLNSVSPIPTQQLAFNSIQFAFQNPNPNSTQLRPELFPFSTLHYFPHSNPLTHFAISHQNPRKCYSTEPGTEFDYNQEVDMINLKFAEAREEIEMAMDSKETVYFDEEAECAKVAVKEVLDLYGGLLSRLEESQKEALHRSMGLKIEQLKAELEQLKD